jgi:WhiB family transcriptional regulator, redox-sensing transcriptional regulator
MTSDVRASMATKVQLSDDMDVMAWFADLATTEPPRWQDDALCAQVGGDIFFPEKGQPVRDAKALCDRCPVQAACLEDALARDERFGIWGGKSERERRRIKKDRQAAIAAAAESTDT